ncbi:uncharacterized protein ISCGN_005784, partial [Ixodes scapularis]
REGEEVSSETAHGNPHGTPKDVTRRGTRCDPEDWECHPDQAEADMISKHRNLATYGNLRNCITRVKGTPTQHFFEGGALKGELRLK